MQRFYVGLRPETLDMLRHFTVYHGRGASPEAAYVQEEVRAALDFYIAEAMVDALSRDEFVAGLIAGKPGFDVEEERAKAADLRDEKRARAFGYETKLDNSSLLENLRKPGARK